MAAKIEEKPATEERQLALLEARYDLADRPSNTLVSSGGKPVQVGVRARLPDGYTWESLAELTPDQIRDQDVFPLGFMALPHPKHPEGGMLFPQPQIDEVLRQTGRDLNRFDLEFDLPEHLLPDFPSPIFLTTHKELGDVSQGQLVTTDNYYDLFKCLLNPKQLDGLRLLLTPFPQQQFNNIDDRRSERPSLGVACLDCHSNGHTNAATHLVGDIRPQALRNRIDTPSLRGVNLQQIFGSQRALSSIEDFTEFEQRAAYFDGDPVLATKKGVSPLDRGLQVHHMAEFQKLLDFPPAPKLDSTGRLDPSLATPEELRGEELFRGKARCAECHTGAEFTDSSMHDLGLEGFYESRMINGMQTRAEGPIKTFTLRGLKDSPPYFHDGRLLTIEDTIEFFNLVLQLKLASQDKADLLAFLQAL
jgi:cytochrome c peroxidase